MALPEPKQEERRKTNTGAALPERREPGPAGDMHRAVESPARNLQAKLHSELNVPVMPSARQALTMALVVSLACAAAAITLLSKGLIHIS